ncbi:MAG: ABC transporter permease subunit [Deltaproteobacteria bacterium]|nr:ABC transporter permease subunit [Deltaproteobacteria bacterium]
MARDVNTLLLTVLFPLFLFPGAVWGMTQVESMREGWEEGLRPRVTVEGDAREPLPENVVEAIDRPAVARLTWRESEVEIAYRASDPESVIARDRLVDALDDPWPLEVHDVAPPGEALSVVVARVVPLILVVLSLFASMYPAVEAVVADRERGTQETSLSTAAPRWVFLAGKLVAVAAITLFAVSASVLSAAATLVHVAVLVGAEIALDPLRLLAIFPLAVLTALYGACVSLLAAAPTRSFKQAQNTASAAVTAVMLLALVGVLPRAELGSGLGWLPVSNAVLVMRAWLEGETPWAWTGVAAGELLLLGVASVWLATRWLRPGSLA